MGIYNRLRTFGFILMALAALHPAIPGEIALLTGIAFALGFGNPVPTLTKRWTPRLLQISIVGLGAGMDLGVVARVGSQGVVYTAIGIGLTLAIGFGLGLFMKTDRETSCLLSVGTAICGGSAIAAAAPVIRAKSQSVSVALATVFLLNASALVFFPWLGRHFGLTEQQFGLFSALAIHDTSSVVGAAMRYGSESLSIATTVKLARALWIIPVTFALAWLWRERDIARPKTKVPWFIFGFLATAALVTWITELKPAGQLTAVCARRSLVVTLFLIGSGLTRETLKSVGLRPFLQGFVLWLAVMTGTLAAILSGVIR